MPSRIRWLYWVLGTKHTSLNTEVKSHVTVLIIKSSHQLSLSASQQINAQLKQNKKKSVLSMNRKAVPGSQPGPFTNIPKPYLKRPIRKGGTSQQGALCRCLTHGQPSSIPNHPTQSPSLLGVILSRPRSNPYALSGVIQNQNQKKMKQN